MLKTKAAHHRIGSLLIIQVVLIFVTILSFATLFFIINKFICLICFSSLLLIQLALIPISVFAWNQIMVIDTTGIWYKKRLLKWEDWTDVKITSKVPTRYGPLYVRLVITYKNGDVFRFEPNGPVIRDIYRYCNTQDFLNKIKDTTGIN